MKAEETINFNNLLQKIKNNDPTLTKIDNTTLGVRCIDNGKAIALAEALKLNQIVTEVSLPNSFRDNESAPVWSEVIKSNSALIKINLRKNFSITSMKLFAEALKHNTRLAEIYLGGLSWEIDNTSARYIAETIKINQSLTTFWIEHFRISEDAFKVIFEAIKDNSMLTNMYRFRVPYHCEAERILKVNSLRQQAIASINTLASIPLGEGFANKLDSLCKQKQDFKDKIMKLQPTASQGLLEQIETAWLEQQITLAIANPTWFEPQVVLGLFDQLQENDKKLPKFQGFLEKICLDYYGLLVNPEYSPIELLRYLLQIINRSAGIELIIDQCLLKSMEPNARDTVDLKPLRIVESLNAHPDKLQTLLTTLPEALVLINEVLSRASSLDCSEQEAKSILQVSLLMKKALSQPENSSFPPNNLRSAGSASASASASSFFNTTTLPELEKGHFGSHLQPK